MVKRRKGFSATQSKITSLRIRSATVGTHVPKRSSRHMNAESVGFSSARKNKRATRGMVDTLLPSTVTGESSSEYSRRVSRREFTQEIQRKARIRRLVILVVCLIAVLGIAVGVGVATFFGSLDSKLALNNSDAPTALVAPAEGEPFYTLVAADLGNGEGVAADIAGPDALVLARIDRANKQVSLVSIPANLRVSLSDGKVHPVRDAGTWSDAVLITAVATFAEVDIAHYVKTDATGIAALVDSLGGVEVTLSEEVDDPTAGDVYLPTGTQTLDGKSALTFLRASNFKNGIETQAENQRELLETVCLSLLGTDSLGFLTTLDSVGGTFHTDMNASDARSLADSLRGMDATQVRGTMVPGYTTTRDGVDYYAATSDDWTAMVERLDAGEDPDPPDDAAVTVDPASFSVSVQNGSGVTGGAAQIGNELTAKGFKVEATGNVTDAYSYNETLVVYTDAAFEAAAQTVVSSLGVGRTVQNTGYYEFETDVLVIIGKDWKPIA